MQKIKQYLKTEDFRFFVEKSSKDETNLISMLKILDKHYSEFICSETPVIQERMTIKSIGPSSYYRPDFVSFRKRVVETFTSESWTKLIVLLPCSSKKPYSLSKSHRKFLSVMKKKANFSQIQEFILTSPLGVIPRQLETIYPANSYDISVTGEWDDAEIKITENMLLKFLEKYNSQIPIICHLPKGGYQEIVAKVIDKTDHNFYFTDIVGSTTSRDSLASLENSIEKFNLNPIQSIPKVNYHKRDLEKIIDYFYGKNVGELLLSGDYKIKEDRRRKLSFIVDLKSKSNLGKYDQNTGELELSLKGANKIKEYFRKHKYLIFDGKQMRGSTLFRPGIIDYSLNLKPKEYVMIWDNEKQNIIAIAKMIVGASFLKNSKSGRIAEIINRTGK
jgi:archaeosine synthase